MKYHDVDDRITATAADVVLVRMKFHRAVREFRRALLAQAIQRTKTKTEAAAALGLSRPYFQRLAAKEHD